MSSKSPKNVQCFASIIGQDLVNQYIKQQNENLEKDMTSYLNCLITEFKQNANLIGMDTIETNLCTADVSKNPIVLAIDKVLKLQMNWNLKKVK